MALILAANSGEDTISVLCTETMKELYRFPLSNGTKPLGLRRMVFEGGLLYVCASFANAIIKADTRGKQTGSTMVGKYPTDICVSEGYLYVCCGECDCIWKVDIKSFSSVGCMPCGGFPNSISTYDHSLIVANVVSANAAIIKTEANGEPVILNPQGPCYYAAYSRDTGRVCCSNQCSFEGESGCVSFFDPEGNLIKRLDAGIMPGVIRFFDHGKKAAVADTGGIFIMDCTSMEMEGYFPCSGMIDDIEICGDEGLILCSNMEEDCVEAITFKGKHAGHIKTGREPRGLTIVD